MTKKQKRKRRPAEEQQLARQQPSPPPQRDTNPKSNGISSSKSWATTNGSLERPTNKKVIKSQLTLPEINDLNAAKMSSKTDLDLATDFPPLFVQPSSSNAAPVWPVVRPSSNPSDKSSAVMKSSSACELNCIKDPPETSVQVSFC